MEFVSRLKDFPFSLVCSRKYAYPNNSLWFLVFEESFLSFLFELFIY